MFHRKQHTNNILSKHPTMKPCLFMAILTILTIFIFQNGLNIYFVKYSFSFQHIQNVNSATVKNYFRFLLSHKILF